MTVRFNGDAKKNEALRQGARRLQRAGVFFKNSHKAQLGVSNPRPYKTPSLPGEYPRKRTGAAQQGVMTDVSSVEEIVGNGMRVRVGVPANVWYLIHLEQNMARLGFEKSVETLKPMVAAILGQTA